MSSPSTVSNSMKYRIISLDHFDELTNFTSDLKKSNKLSDNEIFVKYLNHLSFNRPEKFPEAQSIIIVAVPTSLAQFTCEFEGKSHEVWIPPQYYYDDITADGVLDQLKQEIEFKPTAKIERASGIHLKLLAVRSGLGKYGRNNICYVDEWGSFITLLAFYTDQQFTENHWGPLQMMDYCKNCQYCITACPNQAIGTENFVIDVNRCTTLYNEIEGDFPDWIPSSAHNALMGCLKCQYNCPGNAEAKKNVLHLGNLSEKETEMFLNQKLSKETIQKISEEIKIFKPETVDQVLPTLSRNLAVLLKKS
jgi:epoxyqueuosine reductase